MPRGTDIPRKRRLVALWWQLVNFYVRAYHEPVARLGGILLVIVSVAGGYLGYFLGHSRAGEWFSDGAAFYFSAWFFVGGIYLIVTNEWDV
jgi:hypothetical protein